MERVNSLWLASKFTRNAHELNLQCLFGDYTFKMSITSPKGQWVQNTRISLSVLGWLKWVKSGLHTDTNDTVDELALGGQLKEQSIERINSLWLSDAIRRHRSGSTVTQATACCLAVPRHFLNQCWFIISEVFVAITCGQFQSKCSRYLSSIWF